MLILVLVLMSLFLLGLALEGEAGRDEDKEGHSSSLLSTVRSSLPLVSGEDKEAVRSPFKLIELIGTDAEPDAAPDTEGDAMADRTEEGVGDVAWSQLDKIALERVGAGILVMAGLDGLEAVCASKALSLVLVVEDDSLIDLKLLMTVAPPPALLLGLPGPVCALLPPSVNPAAFAFIRKVLLWL